MSLKVKNKHKLPRPNRSYEVLPQKVVKKQQRSHRLKRLVRSMAGLVVIAVIAGVGYTWYMGQQQSAVATEPMPIYKKRATISPPKLAKDARVGVSVQTVTAELKPGQNAEMSVRTNPDIDCMIDVLYGETKAVDSGLVAKKSDEFGVVGWSWTVPAATPLGKGKSSVTCKNVKHSAVVSVDTIVKQ